MRAISRVSDDETTGRDVHGIQMRMISRYAWLPAITASLAISTYSLYWIARKWGLPIPLAALVSTVFDGAALTFADLALRYARTHGDSGLAPRLGVLILAGLSAYLNSWHAVLTGAPTPARILYGIPPIVSIALFDLHTRWERRAALRRAGRVPASLPVFGRYTWLLFPIRTLKVLRSIVRFRLETVMNAHGVTPVKPPNAQVSDGNPAIIRNWAREHGLNVSDKGRIARDVIAAYEDSISKNGSKAHV